MKIAEICNVLNLKVLTGENLLGKNVTGGYVSDLLSDVMGNAKEGQIWITLQNHRNILAVASLKDLSGIVIVKNQAPDAETIARAVEEGIAVLVSSEDTFTVAGKIYELLNKK